MKGRIAIICLLFPMISFAQISNLIVFGDSLSDGGNFPESSNPKMAQLYVPFSNPVVLQPGIPVLNNQYLSPQAPIENNPAKRKYRSISWPQFFLQSKIIAPSNLLNTRNIPANFSFNYAWGYATSQKYCVNPHYQTIVKCTAESIFEARENYVENPTPENYLKIEVPGLNKQLQLFFLDMQHNKVNVDKNTMYAFWIGGNDLIVASNALLKHYNPLPLLNFMFGSVAKSTLKNISLLTHNLPDNKKPARVYVFELFNPGLTPVYYQTALGSLGFFVIRQIRGGR